MIQSSSEPLPCKLAPIIDRVVIADEMEVVERRGVAEGKYMWKRDAWKERERGREMEESEEKEDVRSDSAIDSLSSHRLLPPAFAIRIEKLLKGCVSTSLIMPRAPSFLLPQVC